MKNLCALNMGGSFPCRRGAARGLLISATIVVVAIVAWQTAATKGWVKQFGSEVKNDSDSSYVLHPAEFAPFRDSITENGTVNSLKNSTLKNSVQGTTTIITLVPEGSQVNAPVASEVTGVVDSIDSESAAETTFRVSPPEGDPKTYTHPMGPFTEVLVAKGDLVEAGDYLAGDVVCELDSSTLVEKEKQQQIDVTVAEANVEKAKKTLEIQKSTNESVLAQAKLAEKLAQLDLKKYTAPGGEYEQEQQTIEGDIKQLEEQLAMAQEEYENVRDQARRGYTNLNNLEAARMKVTQQKIQMGINASKLKLLKDFTRIRTESELKQTAEDSVRETERAALEGEAAMAGFVADFNARTLTLQVEQEKLDRLIRQIKACRLVAPQNGEVVYASQTSRRSQPVLIEEGATVRERQAIINLPDLDQMKIDARIHESRISRVVIGQDVEITIDAVTSVTYHGILETISSVPVPGSWPNTDLKEYEAGIRITDSNELMRQLKPGMTAEVRVIVEDRPEDVLQIPIQSMLQMADQYYVYAENKDGFERRELKIGNQNNEYVEILSGVEEHDMVLMNPRAHFAREIKEIEDRLLNEQKGKDKKKTDRPPRTAGRRSKSSDRDRKPSGQKS